METWTDWQIEPDNRSLPSVISSGVLLKPGDSVRLRPLGRSDIMDIALDGKIATIVAIEQDYEDRIHVAVTVNDDPGRDFGRDGKIGHRFFFGIDEIEPVATSEQLEKEISNEQP